MAQFILENAPALRRKLKMLGSSRQFRAVVRKVLPEAAKPVLQQTKALAPFETGQLRRSLRIRAGKRSRKLISVFIDPGTKADLGISADATGFFPAHLELGTKFFPEKRFMRRAMDMKRVSATAMISRQLGAGIERLATT